jgi:hypothetical protein
MALETVCALEFRSMPEKSSDATSGPQAQARGGDFELNGDFSAVKPSRALTR